MARVIRFKKSTLMKVLAFMAVSAVFTVWLAVKIGNLQIFEHTYTLNAVFSNAAGVFKGDSVKLAGVDVGRVSSASIDHGDAVVQFNVDDSVKLTQDTVAAIRWRNVLGQRYLYLYPGSGQGAPLRDGDTIPLSHTENAGDLDQLLNELGPILRAIDPAKANAFVDAVNTALPPWPATRGTSGPSSTTAPCWPAGWRGWTSRSRPWWAPRTASSRPTPTRARRCAGSWTTSTTWADAWTP